MEEPISSPGQKKTFAKAGVYFGLALIFVLVLFYSQIFSFFSAFPIFFISIQLGGVAGFILLLISGGAIFQHNPVDALFLVFTTGAAAVFAGFFFRKAGGAARIDDAILKGALVVAAALTLVFVSMVHVPFIRDDARVRTMKADIQKNLDLFYTQVQASTQKLRDFPPTPVEIEKEKRQFLFWATALIPGGLIAMTALSIWIYFILLRSWLKKQGFAGAYGQLRQWRSSEKTIWALIATLTALILGHEPAKVPALNALIVILTVYLFQGIAVTVFFLRRWRLSAWMRFAGYVAVLIFHKQVAIVLIVMGFFDVWFDFRKAKGVA